jgi:basic amino acid/polyamine antiporter, APA family
MQQPKLGFGTSISLVVANMIGTGVFTSLGFQVMGIQSGFAIMALWVLGGIIALCGALCYAEIGSAFPQSGGEYNYLSKLYHPAIGFLSGWVSVTVGFAAPIAAASVALGKYVHNIYPNVNEVGLAIGVIVAITIMHAISTQFGATFQRMFTLVKIVIIVMFAGFGLFHIPEHHISFVSDATAWKDIFSASFAGSLIYVTYAYSGWNAAAYVAGEIENVNKTLPRALVLGTLIVLLVYTVLNYVFLYSVPINELKGVVEVGYLSANKIFGKQLGQFMSLTIAVLLVSTISAMVLAGPRVMQSMGRDLKGLGFLSITNKNEVPYISVIIQSIIAIALVLVSKFEELITYVGFTLNLFTFLTVAGVFILRYKLKLKTKDGFKMPLFPLPAIIFLVIIGWILLNLMQQKTKESLYGLLTVLVGFLFYLLVQYRSSKK